jgi:hypothetical protein
MLPRSTSKYRIIAGSIWAYVDLLKTRYRDGTTHVVLEPHDYMARKCAARIKQVITDF